MSGYVITTGDASVVRVGATTHGNVQASRDHYSADVVGSQGAGSRGKIAMSWLPPRLS